VICASVLGVILVQVFLPVHMTASAIIRRFITLVFKLSVGTDIVRTVDQAFSVKNDIYEEHFY